MATARDVVTFALKKCGAVGVGQTALAEDINDGFTELQDMLAQWQRKRWLVYALRTYSIVSTGAVSYTIGPGGNIAIAGGRPDKIQSAFMRLVTVAAPNQPDWPFQLIFAREDYDRIRLKQLQSWARYLFYDSAYPLGSVYPWPIPPAAQYSIHVTVKELLQQFADLADAVALPPEYNAAMKWNLAQRLRAYYQMPENATINKMAKDALAVIRRANVQIPRLVVPSDLARPRRYNAYSDQNS